MIIISLVVVEACLVVVELMVEAEGGSEKVVEGLHIAALTLLSIFLLEFCIKILILGIQLCKSWVS